MGPLSEALLLVLWDRKVSSQTQLMSERLADHAADLVDFQQAITGYKVVYDEYVQNQHLIVHAKRFLEQTTKWLLTYLPVFLEVNQPESVEEFKFGIHGYLSALAQITSKVETRPNTVNQSQQGHRHPIRSLRLSLPLIRHLSRAKDLQATIFWYRVCQCWFYTWNLMRTAKKMFHF